LTHGQCIYHFFRGYLPQHNIDPLPSRDPTSLQTLILNLILNTQSEKAAAIPHHWLQPGGESGLLSSPPGEGEVRVSKSGIMGKSANC